MLLHVYITRPTAAQKTTVLTASSSHDLKTKLSLLVIFNQSQVPSIK